MKLTALALFTFWMPATFAPAHAQQAPQSGYHYTLPLSTAVEAAREAIRVCEENHYWVTATVVDMDGVPQVVMRGDHATVHTGESSFRKAFTVVTLGPEFGFDRSSGFFQLTKTNPFAPQLATVRNVMALPGAVAIRANGEMVGALGIGGAPGGDKDEVCAAAGIAKIADQLPH
ncbi:heme-binding protein [Paraburkholderia sp. MMS20-SJTN17]|uniref:Heme-binding protein n=1 Tax=Paraburkholderia translucens TaxID=2886945 RepID=A0ABS8KJS5_9BURK|nr:heme-binding protein [Paraburkholderia sp. MMS20-SJTN17]MCC8404654.1 heme-binding protein [Paraburkholderia sp. MMS20-SJTN17]